MAFQYQYQYGYQIQPGYQAYLSFYQLLHDIPLALPLFSLAVATTPFLLYFAWRRGYTASVYHYLRAGASQLQRRRASAEIENRVKMEYTLFAGEEMKMSGLTYLSGLLGVVLVGFLILNKMLFFSLVLTESMMPVLNPADLVLIEALSKEVQVGDIVMFQPAGELNPIIHRVIGMSDSSVTTKGDASVRVDEWKTPVNEILGKAVVISGNPVIVKNIGWYFMPIKVYIPGSDPTLEFIQDSVKFVHESGPLIVVVMIIFLLITSFEGKRYADIYQA